MLLVVEVALALAIVAGLLALVIRPASEARSPGEPSAPDAAADAATDDPRAAA
jgi:hypothetical protein